MAFPLSSILDFLDISFDYMFSGISSADADGHKLGQISIVYGTYYYRHLNGATTTENGRISLNTSVAFIDSAHVNMPGVRLYWEGNPTSTAYFGSNSNAIYIGRPANSSTHLVIGSTDNNIDDRDLAVYWGTVPTITENEVVTWRSYPYYLMGSPRIASNSNNANIQNARVYSSASDATIVFPIDPDEVYTYNDVVNIIVPFLQDNGYPDITADDLPQFDDINPTEPTEPEETLPSGSGFVFDYGEVISPSELESILDQETYEIDTVQSLELVNLEMPELDTLPQDMVVAAGSLMTAVTPIFTETGLLVIFLPLAIVMILIIFLRRGR